MQRTIRPSVVTLPSDSLQSTVRGPDTASLFVPQQFVPPRPCCPEYPRRTPLYRKFIEYGCFLLVGCGFQLLALGIAESREFDMAIGQGFYMVENYFKAASSGTSFVAALLGAVSIRINSLRAMIGFVCLLCLNIVLLGLSLGLTENYSADQLIHSYVKEYVVTEDEYSTSAKKMLNKIQHEFGCCGGRHGPDDFGKNQELLPASCCYSAEHEHEALGEDDEEEDEEHDDDHDDKGPKKPKKEDRFCNRTATPHAVHPKSCSQVTGRYIQHVLQSSVITCYYVVAVSVFCLIFGVLYGLEVWKASQGHQNLNPEGEDLRAAEDLSRALLFQDSRMTVAAQRKP